MDDYIKIQQAENGGFVITMCDADGEDEHGDMDSEKTYVYKTLEEALKDIPGMFSILQEGDDDGAAEVKAKLNEPNIGTTKSEMKAKGY